MSKITKVNAFYEIANAMCNGETTKANKMMRVVENSLASDKKKNANIYSSEINLKKEDKKKFASIGY